MVQAGRSQAAQIVVEGFRVVAVEHRHVHVGCMRQQVALAIPTCMFAQQLRARPSSPAEQGAALQNQWRVVPVEHILKCDQRLERIAFLS